MSILTSEKLMIVLIILTAVMIVAFIADMIQKRKLYRRYDLFMRGKDAESLEDEIIKVMRSINQLQDWEMATRDLLMVLSRGVSTSIQKTSIVRYNALPGMGGQSSFVLALLDQQNNGLLLNAMHTRSSCYMYVKEVHQGKCEAELSHEETDALTIAISKKSKYFGDDMPEEASYMNIDLGKVKETKQ